MSTNTGMQSAFNEPERPQFHFTPQANWMNDPNGLLYYQGEYHLFYQHHPGSISSGPMHWGHAVSHNLVHWTHLPIALYPDEQGDAWSGSAVVDANNTSGFFLVVQGWPLSIRVLIRCHSSSALPIVVIVVEPGRSISTILSSRIQV